MNFLLLCDMHVNGTTDLWTQNIINLSVSTGTLWSRGKVWGNNFVSFRKLQQHWKKARNCPTYSWAPHSTKPSLLSETHVKTHIIFYLCVHVLKIIFPFSPNFLKKSFPGTPFLISMCPSCLSQSGNYLCKMNFIVSFFYVLHALHTYIHNVTIIGMFLF